jgi:tetratricopeptide (TPR) repeat protein
VPRRPFGLRLFQHECGIAKAPLAHEDEIELQALLTRMDDLVGFRPSVRRGKKGLIVEEADRPRLDPHGQHQLVHAFDNPEQSFEVLPGAFRTRTSVVTRRGKPAKTTTRTWFSTNGAPDERPDAWDWYAYSRLIDAQLELGQWNRATKLLARARAQLAIDGSATLRFGYSTMAKAYLAKTGRWNEAESLAMPLLDWPRDRRPPVSCAEQRPPFDLFARLAAHTLLAEAALRASDPDAAEQHADDIATVVESMEPWAERAGLTAPSLRSSAYGAEIRARAQLIRSPTPDAEKRAMNAIELTAQQADELPLGPGLFISGRERLAEAMVVAGRPKEALEQYEHVLSRRRLRSVSLLGAARAASAAGDSAKARGHYASLAELWRDADSDVPVLAEVREGSR